MLSFSTPRDLREAYNRGRVYRWSSSWDPFTILSPASAAIAIAPRPFLLTLSKESAQDGLAGPQATSLPLLLAIFWDRKA